MPALYNSIGSNYVATRRADPAIVDRLAALLVPKSGGRYLDVGCGTCNYTSALAARAGSWFGVDVSEVMLEAARIAHPELSVAIGDVNALPYEAGNFDGAICTLAIHHFRDLKASFSEVRRVLKSGRFVIFTGLPEQMRHYWLCHYFPRMMERSIENMPSQQSIIDSLDSAGFYQPETHPFFITPELQDLFLYSGKSRPEIYFDSVVRSNISSFARLCTDEELQSGLEALMKDLTNDEFRKVARKYSSAIGDYSFVTARTDA